MQRIYVFSVFLRLCVLALKLLFLELFSQLQDTNNASYG